jgi:hypothetical protein
MTRGFLQKIVTLEQRRVKIPRQTVENAGPQVERLPKNYEVVYFVNDVTLQINVRAAQK